MTAANVGSTTGTALRARRGLFDAGLMFLLLYAVYAKTPLGALAETGVRMALGQKDHPSLFSTFKGRETAVDVSAPRIVDATARAALVPQPVVDAAKRAGVEEATLAAVFAVHGRCDAAACTMPTPARLYEALGELAIKQTATVDEIAAGLATTSAAFAGDQDLAIEALYVGRGALSRAVEAARAGGADAPEDPDVHAEFLSPALRRGPLQAALAAVAVRRLETLAWPADPKLRITSSFGPRVHPVTGKQSFHNGTDIATPVGTTLLAAHHARVKRAGKDSISGTYVVLDHGLGIETVYCHMSGVDVAENERIPRKMPIGPSGATGRVTGPHLHYILRVGGEAVDAERYGESPTRAAGAAAAP